MMKPILFLLSYILNTLLLLLAFRSIRAIALQHPTNNETDKHALLAFKDRILGDPLRVMDSWNESSRFCEWRGVSCSKRHEGRVTELDLAGQKLVGSLPPHIGNLSFLRFINLSHNFFNGEIPQEIGHLFRLRILDLKINYGFQGKIPSNLSFCSNLRFIDVTYNELTGEIPIEFRNLLNGLVAFGVGANQLSGTIPQWLGNASSLELLSLGPNNFHGSIPDELGRLTKLQLLQLSGNHLSGKVPFSVFNLSSLIFLSLAQNKLDGIIPSDVGNTLPNIVEFYVDFNSFYGEFPPSFLNATKLESLDVGSNNLRGAIPSNFGILRNLKWLSLTNNQLETAEGEGLGFVTSLTNCSNLELLQLGRNHFKGELPSSIANFSTKLQRLSVGANQISGEIPSYIGNLVGLTVLDFSNMDIAGTIPSSIGNLSNLSQIFLDGNKISGSIPSSFGNITQLQLLNLDNNNLSGPIPLSLGNCFLLEYLYLSGNSLTGNVPKQLFSLSRLIELELEHNSLSGEFPSEVGDMVHLVELNISDNQFSGRIPNTLGKCSMLVQLLMNGNLFQGDIPPSLSTLKSLQWLDLSRNNLSGQIPKFLQNFTLLNYLNLSFNSFEGELPTGGPFGNTSIVSVTGNRGLCGGFHQLGLPSCKIQAKRRKVIISVAIACSALLLVMVVFLAILLYKRKLSRRRRASTEVQFQLPEGFRKISYAELSNATNGFSSSNLIGEGSFGSVFKGILGEERLFVAVKVLNLLQKGASKSFIAECEALRNTRHRNLIKIVTVCSSIDFKGFDFKALVYEFMQNGNLEQWLHPRDKEQASELKLSFIQRLNIAIDVASSIEYLHDHCQPPIVHGDLKPSNVLLDEDMVARVSDFGLARFLSSSLNESSSFGLKGTIGYVAPEYGMNNKSSKPGDVYGFGILLLEMITGKRPTNAIFKDGFTIHQLTKTSLPEGVMDFIDPSMLHKIQDAENPRARNRGIGIRETLVVVARIGVLCSMELPGERMEMKQVVAELNAVRDKFLGGRH